MITMQLAPQILLADLGDVLQPLAPIIFVVLYGVAHLVGNLQQEKRKAPPRPRPVEPPQDFGRLPAGNAAPANAAGGKQPTLEETLRREVEEFLRRAQGQPPQQQKPQPQRAQQRPQQNRPAARRPNLPQLRSGRQSERPAEHQEQPRRLVESQRPEPAAPLSPLTDTRPSYTPTPLGSGVALHSQTLAQHAQTLGADVAQADERMQEHLRQKFVHPMGDLSPTTSVQRQATGTPAAQQLRELISRPGGIRQLIIAHEILRRPEERWEDTVQATDLRRQSSGREK
jgi:hypothetical protein